MRLKYQLRGLGMGMVLTALMMGISSDVAAKQPSDEAIKVRAKELGMIENTVLSELGNKTPTESVAETKPAETEPTETEPAETESIETEFTETEPAETKSIETESTVIEAIEDTEQMAVVVIKPGDGSDAVSRKLEQLGLVENAVQYDKYLCQNGYDKKLRTGTYEIQIGESDEEIAKKISQR